MSLKLGIFPESQKEAKIIPYYKKGEKTNKSNYRPVANLNEIGKLIEAMAEKQIRHYVETQNLLPNCQHDIRHGRSTTTARIASIDKWQNGMNQNKYVVCLFYDVSAAFDLVKPEILVKKIQV